MNNNTLSVVSASSWQLRAEFWATSSCGDDRQLADQVTEAIQELDLEPQQLGRIQKAVLEAVQKASLRGQPSKPVSPVHIRIWVACQYACGRSWGFFLIEKSDSCFRGAPVNMECLVELFLYQERDS